MSNDENPLPTSSNTPLPGGQRRSPTMAEVAAEAHVSPQTVSRVMNGFEGVRPETRIRVEQAVRDLGYRRNFAARTLVTQRSGLIGVIAVGSFLYGPTSTLATIERSARRRNYLTLLATITESSQEQFQAALDEFLDRSVEAVVVIAAREPLVRYSTSLDLGIPLIVVGPRPDDLPNARCISVDQEAGARLAVEHLAELGHRDIALLTGPRHWVDAQQRIQGALATCEEHDIHPRIFSGDWSAESGYRAGTAIAELPAAARPTAVFAANDHMALGLIASLSENELDIPGDLSIVGFDDVPEAAFYTPSLTTVHQDFGELGNRAIASLIAMMGDPGEDNSPSPDFEPVVPHICVRNSTDAPRG